MQVSDLQLQFINFVISAKLKPYRSLGIIRRDDVEDVRGDLIVAVMEAMPKYDQLRAPWEAFINTVVETQLKSMLRSRSAQKRTCPTKIGDVGVEEVADRASLGSSRSHVDLQLDLDEVLEHLTDQQLAIVDELRRELLTPAAKNLGIARRTVRDQTDRIADVFGQAGLQDYL